jgi:hypothetical protein
MSSKNGLPYSCIIHSGLPANNTGIARAHSSWKEVSHIDGRISLSSQVGPQQTEMEGLSRGAGESR